MSDHWNTAKIARCVGCGVFLFAAFMPTGHAQNIIRPETKLVSIDVKGVPEAELGRFVGTYRISPTREITLMDIGKIKITGWGYADLSLAIQKAYRRKGDYPEIEVNVYVADGCCNVGMPCIDITVDGERRDSIDLRFGKMTLAEALVGMPPREPADLTKIEIIRDEKKIIVDATTEAGKNTELKNHDIITVPAPPSQPPTDPMFQRLD